MHLAVTLNFTSAKHYFQLQLFIFVMKSGIQLSCSWISASQVCQASHLMPHQYSHAYVLACHGNCMAGLGESCSHVGAILFAVDVVKRMRENKTVTQENAYWLLPSRGKKSMYGPVSDMNFTSPST